MLTGPVACKGPQISQAHTHACSTYGNCIHIAAKQSVWGTIDVAATLWLLQSHLILKLQHIWYYFMHTLTG